MLSTEKNRRYVMIVFIAAFVIYAVVNSWIGYVDSKNRKKYVEELSHKYLQQQDKLRSLHDSAAIERLKMTFQIIEMEKELREMREQDELFNKIHEDKIKELEKKYRNEKDYIPDATTQQQFEYLSNYKYEPFK